MITVPLCTTYPTARFHWCNRNILGLGDTVRQSSRGISVAFNFLHVGTGRWLSAWVMSAWPYHGIVPRSWSINEGRFLPAIAFHDRQIFHRRSMVEVLNISKLPYGHHHYWHPVAISGIQPWLCVHFVALSYVHFRFMNRRWAPTKTPMCNSGVSDWQTLKHLIIRWGTVLSA